MQSWGSCLQGGDKGELLCWGGPGEPRIPLVVPERGSKCPAPPTGGQGQRGPCRVPRTLGAVGRPELPARHCEDLGQPQPLQAGLALSPGVGHGALVGSSPLTPDLPPCCRVLSRHPGHMENAGVDRALRRSLSGTTRPFRLPQRLSGSQRRQPQIEVVTGLLWMPGRSTKAPGVHGPVGRRPGLDSGGRPHSIRHAELPFFSSQPMFLSKPRVRMRDLRVPRMLSALQNQRAC